MMVIDRYSITFNHSSPYYLSNIGAAKRCACPMHYNLASDICWQNCNLVPQGLKLHNADINENNALVRKNFVLPLFMKWRQIWLLLS